MLDLPADQLETVRTILRSILPNARAWAFGSRVQGRAKPFSDLDLAVENDAPLEWLEIAALKDAFSESNLPIKVDILDVLAASPAFRLLVEEQQVPVL